MMAEIAKAHGRANAYSTMKCPPSKGPFAKPNAMSGMQDMQMQISTFIP